MSPFDAASNPLLGLSYLNVNAPGGVSISGTTAVVQGTAGDDSIDVSATGIVTVSNTKGVVLNTFDASAFPILLINTLGGNDTVTIAPSALFAGGITVLGGTGTQTVDASTGGGSSTVDFGAGTVSGVVGGLITLDNITTLNLDAGAGDITVLGQAVTDNFSVTPTTATTATITITGVGPTVNTTNTRHADDRPCGGQQQRHGEWHSGQRHHYRERHGPPRWRSML